jgi:hypothetical protein
MYDPIAYPVSELPPCPRRGAALAASSWRDRLANTRMIGAATPEISPRGDDRFAQLLLVLGEQRTGLAGLIGVVDEDRPRYWLPMSKPCRFARRWVPDRPERFHQGRRS